MEPHRQNEQSRRSKRCAYSAFAPLLLAPHLLAPFLLAPLPCFGQSLKHARPVTDLHALEERALHSYPGLQAVDHGVAAAKARLTEAELSPFFQFELTGAMAFAPQVEGSPIYSLDPQVPISNPWRPVWSAGISGAVPLWTFGKLSAARRAARAGVRAKEKEKQRTADQVRYDVRRAYFALQMALDLQQLVGEGTSKLEQAQAELASKLEEGDAEVSETDRWRLASASAEIRASASEVERLEAFSREALSALTGLKKVRVPDCPLSAVPFRTKSVEVYVQEALGGRADLAQLDAGLRAREAAVQETAGRYFPDFALALGASTSYGPGITDQTNPFIIDRANYTSYTAALVAAWKLDFPGHVSRHRRAVQEHLETEKLAEEARRGLRVDVAQTLGTLKDAQRRQAAWKEGREASRTWFISSVQAYEVGTLPARDLVDSMKAYFAARSKHVEAIHDVNTSIALLERAVGRRLLEPEQWEKSCEL